MQTQLPLVQSLAGNRPNLKKPLQGHLIKPSYSNPVVDTEAITLSII